MKIDNACLYQDSHEWVRVEGKEAVIGISDYAQAELNDVVYVELPEVDDELEKGEEFGSIESVKAASELYIPAGGTVIAINEELEDAPELVNEDPFGKGWLIRIQLNDPDELEDLMTPEEYQTFAGE